MGDNEKLQIDPSRTVLVIQDLQNDVMIENGAFAESGSPGHASEQNVVENVKAIEPPPHVSRYLPLPPSS